MITHSAPHVVNQSPKLTRFQTWIKTGSKLEQNWSRTGVNDEWHGAHTIGAGEGKAEKVQEQERRDGDGDRERVS